MIAEYSNTGAIIAGCARDGMMGNSLSTMIYNDQKYEMVVCSNDECNDSLGELLNRLQQISPCLDSAKKNHAKSTVKPTTSPSTTTELPLEVNGTTMASNTTNNTGDKKVTPKKKPNSAFSAGISSVALFAGLFVVYLSQ